MTTLRWFTRPAQRRDRPRKSPGEVMICGNTIWVSCERGWSIRLHRSEAQGGFTPLPSRLRSIPVLPWEISRSRCLLWRLWSRWGVSARAEWSHLIAWLCDHDWVGRGYGEWVTVLLLSVRARGSLGSRANSIIRCLWVSMLLWERGLYPSILPTAMLWG